MTMLRRLTKFMTFMVMMLIVSISLSGCAWLALIPLIFTAISAIGSAVGMVGGMIGGKTGQTMQEIGGIASPIGSMGSQAMGVVQTGQDIYSSFSNSTPNTSLTNYGQNSANPQSPVIDTNGESQPTLVSPPQTPPQTLTQGAAN